MDKTGEVIRPAKLWCDTSTARECEEITARLGGFKKTLRTLGNAVLPGFTASKILWLKNNEPELYARTYLVHSASSYLVFRLTGRHMLDYSTAMQYTPLLDIRRLQLDATLAARMGIDPALVPPLAATTRLPGQRG